MNTNQLHNKTKLLNSLQEIKYFLDRGKQIPRIHIEVPTELGIDRVELYLAEEQTLQKWMYSNIAEYIDILQKDITEGVQKGIEDPYNK